MARHSNGESVFSRVARIFEGFDPDHPALTVSELSDRTGIPLPSTSRMVTEMIEYGWLCRDADKRVRLGMRIWELVARAAPVNELRATALPMMTELLAQLGQHVQLSVRSGREVLCVERLSAPGAIRNVTTVGARQPLSVSAPGLVLLAAAPTELREAVLAAPLPAAADNAATDPKALRRLLSEVRRTGVAHCAGCPDPAAAALAVPVRGAGGRTVAALSVVLPNVGAIRPVVPPLQAAGARIGRALGDTGAARTGLPDTLTA
ncbi:IclR family transcriptional regulator [Nocardia sp. alder85J]|uniref:IclR family transcriptional regulator n=1 Tax=Nocardia sp. alder85J TaxID=2862949 RepID=UPI001CD476F9|nr:IclR family transcriptional regulator [Nocardia sp. alder85J]MCX4093253.1 IclR family transcriptional regulator [Nocardia sp. alder85J]